MRVTVQALSGKSICLEMDVNDTILNMKTKLKEIEDTKPNILLYMSFGNLQDTFPNSTIEFPIIGKPYTSNNSISNIQKNETIEFGTLKGLVHWLMMEPRLTEVHPLRHLI